MCGIAGYISRAATADTGLIHRLARTMVHRGPDDEGFALIDPASDRLELFHSDHTPAAARIHRDIAATESHPHQIALAHRRFSIIDPSPAGHQPFVSDDRRLTLAFNGEIYNYVELRTELAQLGHRFNTQCDTEVFMAAYRQWREGCLSRFRGFWAAALYDSDRRAVLMTRDRLGKAPLYVTRHNNRLFFASEIKTLRAATGRGAEDVNPQAIADYLYFGWRDLEDATFFQSITTFPAASFAWVGVDGACRPQRYWSIPQTRQTERQMSVTHAVEAFRHTLGESLDLRLRADVPVGIELSGGLDSSTMVALSARRADQGRPLRVFTASFSGEQNDEAPFARRVIDHLKSPAEFHPIRPDDEDYWLHADQYTHLMDEPIHAVNTFTYHQVWRAMAATGLRVSITGAAADELLAGYQRDYHQPYLRHLLSHGQLGRLHREIQRLSEKPAAAFSGEYWRRLRQAIVNRKVRAQPGMSLVSSPGSAIHPLENTLDPMRLSTRPRPLPRFDLEQSLAANMGSWRMNHWLRVAHQSAMGIPLEPRMPFLDHKVVELAFSLPVTYLIRDGYLKWIMRRAMDGLLPHDICWRPRKWGFRFPFTQWSLQSQDRFWSAIGKSECPHVDASKLRRSWAELAGRNPLFLWRVMNLMLWWKRCVMGERLV